MAGATHSHSIVSTLDIENMYFSQIIQRSFHTWQSKEDKTNANSCYGAITSSSFESLETASLGQGVEKTNSDPISINLDIFQPLIFLRDFSEKDIFQRFVIKEGTDSVNIRLLDVDFTEFSPTELAAMDLEDGEWYLSPSRCIDFFNFSKLLRNYNLSFLDDVESFSTEGISLLLNGGYYPGPDIKSKLSGEKPRIKICENIMPCIKCSGWFLEAPNIQRKSKWPGKSLIENIKASRVYLVPDKRSADKNRWRISCINAECELMRSLSDSQIKCYATLKTLMKNVTSLDPIVECELLKNILFWDAVTFEPANKVWEEQTNVCLQRLVKTLMKALEEGFCKHFFLHGVNILAYEREGNSCVDLKILRERCSQMGIFDSGKQAQIFVDMACLDNVIQHNIQGPHEQLSLSSREIKKSYEGLQSIFIKKYLQPSYDEYVRMHISNTKQDREKAIKCRSKFFQILVVIYATILVINKIFFHTSIHTNSMIFLTFIVTGLLLNLGWSYRWITCFLYSILTINSEWSLISKFSHFVISFPIAKLVAKLMTLFQEPLLPSDKPLRKRTPSIDAIPRTETKAWLVAPMLFLYGLNLLLLSGSRQNGLQGYWDIVVCILANHGHFLVFCPWVELFYRDYNRLVLSLGYARCATVCTSLFVMVMLHYNDYDKSFCLWLIMTSLTVFLCVFTSQSLPVQLSVPVYLIFGIMLFIPTGALYTLMAILYAIYWAFLSLHPLPVIRALRILSVLCVHLCLLTTSLTDILASVNMIFGCSMYIGSLYTIFSETLSKKDRHLLNRIISTLILVTFIGGVAVLTFQNRPISPQEAFLQVSAPITAAMLLYSVGEKYSPIIYKLLKGKKRD